MCTCMELDYFWMKIHWDVGGLTREYNFVEKCFGDDFGLPRSLDGVHPTRKRVAYGFSVGVLFTRELSSTRE